MQNEPKKMNPTTPQAGEDSSCSSVQALAQIIAYHERSKHTLERYAAGPDTLDWDAQPNPFREFAGAPRIRLPLVADQLSASFDALHSPLPSHPARSPSKTWRRCWSLPSAFPHGRNTGRIAGPCAAIPSSGNLHPTEAYVICRQISGIEDGVYHYLSRDHVLEQRCKVTATTSTAHHTDCKSASPPSAGAKHGNTANAHSAIASWTPAMPSVHYAMLPPHWAGA